MDNNITHHPKKVKRIGIMLSGFGKINLSAFRFLVLKMNSLQNTFEFEFLPLDSNDPFVQSLSSKFEINRNSLKGEIPSFLERHQQFLDELNEGYKLKEMPPDYFVLVSPLACFSDNFYSTRKNQLSVLALGNWKRYMSPPSLLEFIIALILREAVSAISPSLRGSIHLGTKGCLFDFTPTLGEVRFKVLNGNICAYCSNALSQDNYPELADELRFILGKEWFGKPSEPMSPANITSKLGYDLFTTRGLEATSWEKFVSTLKEEGTKQLITLIGGIIGGIVLAELLARLSLK
jgi:hypothetical protein